MKHGRIGRSLGHAIVASAVVIGAATQAQAQADDAHAHARGPAESRPTAEQGALVRAVRQATERFRNVTDVSGPGEGFQLTFGCVSGGDFGAMGLHYVNFGLVADGEIDVMQPEIILFEPTRNGGIRITGADYLVVAADWDAKHPGQGPPQLMGQLFHLFDSPNRFGLPPFYTLHVWAWKDNPNGTFVNWNPAVSCDGFAPQP
jgi:hypothetical protein